MYLHFTTKLYYQSVELSIHCSGIDHSFSFDFHYSKSTKLKRTLTLKYERDSSTALYFERKSERLLDNSQWACESTSALWDCCCFISQLRQPIGSIGMEGDCHFFLKTASVYLCACVCPCTLLATPPRPEELLIQRPESSEVTVMFYWRCINLETEAVYSELR